MHKSDCEIVTHTQQQKTRAFQNKLDIQSFERHKKIIYRVIHIVHFLQSSESESESSDSESLDSESLDSGSKLRFYSKTHRISR